MIFKVKDKTYQIKFSLAATLCEECVERVTDLMVRFDEATEGDKRKVIESISGIAPTTLAMLYGGLLHFHGRRGDKTVMTKDDAEDLLYDYLEEHADDENVSLYSILEELLEQMGTDNFFKQIGPDNMGKRAQSEQRKGKKTGAK